MQIRLSQWSLSESILATFQSNMIRVANRSLEQEPDSITKPAWSCGLNTVYITDGKLDSPESSLTDLFTGFVVQRYHTALGPQSHLAKTLAGSAC